MSGLVARKIGMTQVFDEAGLAVPVTVLEVLENVVTFIKSSKTDGYNAVQLGSLESKEKKLTRARVGHLKKNNLPLFRHLEELRLPEDELASYQLGKPVVLEEFLKEGALVDVSGNPKRGGTTGRIKRWNGRRRLMTHGAKHHRHMGSCGAGTTPGRMVPGLKMPGRDRNQVTIKKLLVFKSFQLESSGKRIILLKGAVPGPKSSLISIRRSVLKDWNKTAFALGKAKKSVKQAAVTSN